MKKKTKRKIKKFLEEQGKWFFPYRNLMQNLFSFLILVLFVTWIKTWFVSYKEWGMSMFELWLSGLVVIILIFIVGYLSFTKLTGYFALVSLLELGSLFQKESSLMHIANDVLSFFVILHIIYTVKNWKKLMERFKKHDKSKKTNTLL